MPPSVTTIYYHPKRTSGISLSTLLCCILALASAWLLVAPLVLFSNHFVPSNSGSETESKTSLTSFTDWLNKIEDKVWKPTTSVDDVIDDKNIRNPRIELKNNGEQAASALLASTINEGQNDVESIPQSDKVPLTTKSVSKPENAIITASKVTKSPTAQKRRKTASGFIPVLGHPNSGMFLAKATKKNHAYMEMLEERAVPKKDRKHVTLGENAGRLCNQLLSLATVFTKAKINGWRIGLWGMWKDTVERLFDLNRLKEYGVDFYFVDKRPEEAVRLPAAGEGGCAVRKVFTWLKDYVRPNEKLRAKADELIDELRKGNDKVVAVHRRWFEGACHLMARKGVSHCHLNASYVVDAEWICNYTLGPRLEQSLAQEWRDMQELKTLSMYLSTDSQVNASDDTFFNEANKFGKLTMVQRSGFQVTPNLHRVNPPADESMLVDMWINAKADFYVASPLSSCDQIVGQWRASLREDGDPQMYPRECYDKFGLKQAHDDTVCIGIGGCTCHW